MRKKDRIKLKFLKFCLKLVGWGYEWRHIVVTGKNFSIYYDEKLFHKAKEDSTINFWLPCMRFGESDLYKEEK